MEQLIKDHDKLERKANLKKAISDVDKLINSLKATRNTVAQEPHRATEVLEEQEKQAKYHFNTINDDLKEIYSALTKYGKTLEKKFSRDKPLPFADNEHALASHTTLINRAIAMHLLREGHFEVAQTFVSEASADPPSSSPSGTSMDIDPSPRPSTDSMAMVNSLAAASQKHSRNRTSSQKMWEADFAPTDGQSASLQQQFAEMYSILEALRQNQNLEPAISWARAHSHLLEARGSNLEYDLCRLQYVNTFLHDGAAAALAYGRATLNSFPARYAPQTQELMGALAYIPNLADSPYASLFSTSNSNTTMSAANAFTSEFCALLSLSSASPLLTAVTAGCIALPTLLKLSQIQQVHRTSWTTASELAVEIPLPPAYQFHSIFVCPVSKEQSTDANPPMMMPCMHVICKESLERVSRGARFKCPYCPGESHPQEARRIFL